MVNQPSSVVRFISGEGANSVIGGFTIRNGNASPTGNRGGLEYGFPALLQQCSATALSATALAMALEYRSLTVLP
jgi:hypothetical protein